MIIYMDVDHAVYAYHCIMRPRYLVSSFEIIIKIIRNLENK